MELKDWLNSVNFTKEDLSEDMKSYPPYIVNRCLSGQRDRVLFANEMNKYHHLDSRLQFSFLINIIRKRKRFSKWIKPQIEDDIEVVKKYYGYSNEKSRQILPLLTPQQIDIIRKKVNKGGRK